MTLRQLAWMVSGYSEQVDQVDRSAWWRTSWLYALTFNCHSTKKHVTPAQVNPREKKSSKRVTDGIPLTRANIGGIIDALVAGKKRRANGS